MVESTKLLRRNGLIQFAGKDVTVIGPDLKVGDIAPDASLMRADWSSFSLISDTAGKVRIIGSLLSLNTSVCDRETRRFTQEAATLGERIAILMVSMDLPFMINDWCAAAGIDQAITLSDYLKAEFGPLYGVLVEEYRILRRAIFVVNTRNRLVYVDYMPAFGDEPNYSAVIQAARKALEDME
jgi:thiol peroxidase